MKWNLKPSSQASSDLSKMALLWVALSLYDFHNLLWISSIGCFPTLSFFYLRSGATLPFFAIFFFSLVIILDFNLFTAWGSVKISPFRLGGGTTCPDFRQVFAPAEPKSRPITRAKFLMKNHQKPIKMT